MLNLLKLFLATSVAAGTFAYAANATYNDTQSNDWYTVNQTCKVTEDGGTDNGPLAEYNAEVRNSQGALLGVATYELAVGAFCYNHFKDVDDQLFKNLM